MLIAWIQNNQLPASNEYNGVISAVAPQAILNNLEPLSVGELDDDDLMLELDPPEDFLLHHGQHTHT